MARIKQMYCAVTNTTEVLSCVISTNHDSAVATATVEAKSSYLTLGDSATIDLGYVDDHRVLFTGYVKQIDIKIPNNTLVLTFADVLVRAQDYFVASTNPNNPLTYKGISAEALVEDLMDRAGLDAFDYTETYFTFGINNSFEVNLISAFDYSRMISDVLTWSLWADQNGTVNFKNRKPYVMTGDTGQPGDTADTPIAFTLNEVNTIDYMLSKSERYLRNRIVVYGNEGVYAEASASSSMLPPGFYKSSVLALPGLIDSTGLAQSIADYNLDLLNRVTETLSVTVEGDPILECRKVITVNMDYYGQTADGTWYVFGCDHAWSTAGYTTTLDLRRMLRY